MKFIYPEGATPLSDEDLEGLIPSHIALQSDLNAWEQQNILEGRMRLARRRPGALLTDAAIRRVHKLMFDRTWRWAGKYRSSGKNIGVDWRRIPEELMVLCADVQYWIDHSTYGQDEIASRFHHRLVFIHPFPNGNGRHGRLMADLLLESLGKPPFTWGSADLNAVGAARERYLAALHAGDKHDYHLLLRFVRT